MADKTGGCRLDVTDFGAKGDGAADDTEAFRKALTEAGKIGGTVFVPEGIYPSGELKMPAHTALLANPTWSYQTPAGAILKLNDPTADCLIDVSDSPGATITGLCLHGNGKLGTKVHGILIRQSDNKKEEDGTRIERCQLIQFSGDAVHLRSAWCFSIRGCEIIFNQGNAVTVRGWDGFIIDNWFSANGGAGYYSDDVNAAVTMTGNRIEWNAKGGITILGGNHYNITGNYIDRSGGPGITLGLRDGAPCHTITATGNVIYRSGRPEWTGEDPLDSAHVRFEGCHGLVFSANSLCVGRDDGGGITSPQYGMVLRGLKNSIIKNNTLHIGAVTELIKDLGEHDDGVIVGDNVGSLYTDVDKFIWSSDQL